MVNYNLELLNPTDLTSSFFCLSKTDPSLGFAFDASKVAGQTYPGQADASSGKRSPFSYQVFVPGTDGRNICNISPGTLRRAKPRHDAAFLICCVGVFTERFVSNVPEKNASPESLILRPIAVYIPCIHQPYHAKGSRTASSFTCVCSRYGTEASGPIASLSYTSESRVPTSVAVGADCGVGIHK